MCDYIVMDDSPNFSEKANCVKDEYKWKSLHDEGLDTLCRSVPLSEYGNGSSLDILSYGCAHCTLCAQHYML